MIGAAFIMYVLGYSLNILTLLSMVLAIGLVVASGVGVLVMSLSIHDGLKETAQAYYDHYRFADVTGIERGNTVQSVSMRLERTNGGKRHLVG